MADVADRAQQDIELYQDAMKTDYELPPGKPGECVECEEHSPRLVGGLCATCRDIRERAAKRKGL